MRSERASGSISNDLTTTLSQRYQQRLVYLPFGIGKLVQRFAQIYRRCPPTILTIAWFQLLIIAAYILLDLIPRLVGSVGSGFSVLFGLIPFSYLLLYTDVTSQERGEHLIRGTIGLTLMVLLGGWVGSMLLVQNGLALQIVNLLSMMIVISGALVTTIVILARRRPPETVLSDTLDRLFQQSSQQHFWRHMTTEVGRVLHVESWLWVVREPDQRWRVLEITDTARVTWLSAPSVQAGLSRLELLRALDVVVDTDELPTTLILLPIAREQMIYEVILVANPRRPGVGRRLLDPHV
jgi:hypothetical protein